MFNIQTLLRQAMLALVLCGASLAAHADVIPSSFRVTLNSAGVPDAAFLDMSFASFGGAAEATATVSNLQGAFGEVDSSTDGVAFLPGDVYTISNQGTNYLTFDITPGGSFSFDVAFGGAFLTEAGDFTSFFSAALLDIGYMPLGGEFGDAIFSVTQLSATGAAAISFETSEIGAVAPATEVPEPSELLLMLTGLALVGAMARRRQA
jgi:hypothetical protein